MEEHEYRWRPGDLVGPYRLRKSIGLGGMAEVHEGEHEHIPRQAAIKLLQLERAEKSDFRDRLKQEAGLLATLNHPNVVRLWDAGVAGNDFWIAMELLTGKTLDVLLHMTGAFTVPNALHVMAEVADGIQAAHEIGVIHRDLKPANIFVTLQHEVKVLDFGTAKFRNKGVKTTDKYRIIGTFAYMSPEQLLNNPPLDRRTDMFSLGVLTYQLLLGRHPYSDPDGGMEDSRSIGERILMFDPQPLTELRSDCPDYAWDVIARAMKRDREARYGSMSELARDARAARKRYMAEFGVPEGMFRLESEAGARRQYKAPQTMRPPLEEPALPSRRVVVPETPGAQADKTAPAARASLPSAPILLPTAPILKTERVAPLAASLTAGTAPLGVWNPMPAKADGGGGRPSPAPNFAQVVPPGPKDKTPMSELVAYPTTSAAPKGRTVRMTPAPAIVPSGPEEISTAPVARDGSVGRATRLGAVLGVLLGVTTALVIVLVQWKSRHAAHGSEAELGGPPTTVAAEPAAVPAEPATAPTAPDTVAPPATAAPLVDEAAPTAAPKAAPTATSSSAPTDRPVKEVGPSAKSTGDPPIGPSPGATGNLPKPPASKPPTGPGKQPMPDHGLF